MRSFRQRRRFRSSLIRAVLTAPNGSRPKSELVRAIWLSATTRKAIWALTDSVSTEPHMKITVFGLGYVGSVVSACMAQDGHDVTGIDLDISKVTAINSSQSPIVEPQLKEAIAKAVGAGRLRAQ